MRWIVFSHLVGAALYIGAAVAALVNERRLGAMAGDAPAARGLVGLERSLSRLTSVGIALIFVSGIVALMGRGWLAGLGTQVWLHVMMTAALVTAALDGIAGASGRKAGAALDSGDATLATARAGRAFALRAAGVAFALVALAASVWRWRAG